MALPALPFWPSYDDAFITLASAQALWAGQIPGFPNAAPLHGVTSPVHCALVAALLPMTRSPLDALAWSQVVALTLYVVGLWHLTRPLRWPSRVGVLLVGCLAGTTWHQLTNGLETGLAMATATWLLVGLRDQRRWAVVILGVAPYVRPEFAPIALCVVAGRLWRGGRSELPFVSAAALAAAPWALWLYLQTGQVIQSSLSVKLAMEASRTPTPDARILMVLIAAGLFAWACGPVVTGLWWVRQQASGGAVLAGLGLALAGYVVTQPSLLVEYHAQRYAYPILPFALAGLVCWLRHRPRRIAGMVVAVVLLFAIVRAYANAQFPLAWRIHVATELPAVVNMLRTLPPTAVVAVGDAGYPAFATSFRLVDFVGLKSPDVATVHRRLTASGESETSTPPLTRSFAATASRRSWFGRAGTTKSGLCVG